MSGQQKFYITTAISYPNGPPHIGHAYEAIATDAIARFERLDGKDVLFLTGTDEHGLKMKQTATKEGLSPRALADRNSARFRAMAEALAISNDDFIRTTEERHYRSSEEIWRRMEKTGDIFLEKYAGWYSVRDEAYYDENETKVGADGVRRGPQGTPVDWTEEETYFFRLSAYQDRLLAHYEEHPDFILPPERRNEVVSFVKRGLEDLSVSRTTLDWGITVPGAPDHVMYVWVDALTNYITAAGFPDEKADALALLAGRCARHRQGHRALPRGLLAGIPDVGGHRAAQARVRARLPLQPRGEDVEVGRQRGRSVRPREGLRCRPGALLLPARGRVRPGRHLQPGGDRQPDQRRSRQRPRQPGAALAVDDPQELRRQDPRAGSPSRMPTRRSSRRPTRSTPRRARPWTGRRIKAYLDAVWAVVADANRYFAGEEPWAKRKTDSERMGRSST